MGVGSYVADAFRPFSPSHRSAGLMGKEER